MASEALIKVEFSQTLVPMMLLTDAGDHLQYNSGTKHWSGALNYEPVVLPNGIRSGGTITPTAVDDQVSVAEMELNIEGVIHTEPSATLTVARPALANKVRISSVTFVKSSLALAMVAGTEGNAIVETRAAAGGPPLIPVDSVEIGQVRFTSDTAAAVLASEIKQTPGTHTEFAGYPVERLDAELGTVTMSASLPLVHTGSLPKRIYAQFYTADPIKIDNADAFTPPMTTASVTSTPTYDGPIASSSEAINGGSFTVILKNGITDPIMKKLNNTLWIWMWPKKTMPSQYWVLQGKLTCALSYPSSGNIVGTFTITPEKAATAVGGL